MSNAFNHDSEVLRPSGMMANAPDYGNDYENNYDLDFAVTHRNSRRAPSNRITGSLYGEKPTLLQRFILLLLTWCSPRLTGIFIILAACPLIILVAMSPAMVSSVPLIDALNDLANARALTQNGSDRGSGHDVSGMWSQTALPLYTYILMATDWLVLNISAAGETMSVGRIYLIAKSLLATGLVFALSLTLNVRLPIIAAILVSCGAVLAVLNPLGSGLPMASSMIMVLLLISLCAPVKDSPKRAINEGAFCGVLLTGLLLTTPPLFFIGVLAATACPYLAGQYRGVRYLMTIGIFIITASLLFLFVPHMVGVILDSFESWGSGWRVLGGEAPIGGEKADLVSIILSSFSQQMVSLYGFLGALTLPMEIMVSILVMMFIFVSVAMMSDKKALGVLGAGLLLLISGILILFSIRGSIGGPIGGEVTNGFMLSGIMAPFILTSIIVLCFAVNAPLYREVYNRPSRAGYSTAFLLVGLVLTQSALVIFPVSQNVVKQFHLANTLNMNNDISHLEKRFSIMLVDQNSDLLGPSRDNNTDSLQTLVSIIDGYEKPQEKIAILTAVDFLCMLNNQQTCFQNGRVAASKANIVFVPHIDLGPHTQATIERSQGLLYTHFKRTNQTPDWDVWERR